LFVRVNWLLLLFVPLLAMNGFGIGALTTQTLLLVSLMALYMRSDVAVPLFGVRWHVSALCAWAYGLMVLGLALAHAEMFKLPFVIFLAVSGWLAQRFRQPSQLRELRAGLWMYVMWGLLVMLVSALHWWHPQPETAEAVAKQVADMAAAVSKESRLMSDDSWWALVQYRLQGGAAGFSVSVEHTMAVFLIGFWFIRSGVMRNVQAHLPLFRKLAFLALPAGVLLSVVMLLMEPNAIIGQNDAQFRFANELGYSLAGLLGALGYLGLVTVLMQGAAAKWLSWLAPAGRMALTNYLMQSVLMGFFFYGYGLGHYGMGRAGQFAFVLVVYAAQVVFSHIWLRYFRYGPFEWLWRNVTYWRWQPLREFSPLPSGEGARRSCPVSNTGQAPMGEGLFFFSLKWRGTSCS
jgi:uncharacterized membrane protein YeiB